ncbi:hypothetical protein [Streptomyces sp. NPDC056883]|uniref:hypothetical protein n=1 Tax=Streptomyces sp. NPDC056883 TaxID=3345959 RepID=UPI0036B1F3FF
MGIHVPGRISQADMDPLLEYGHSRDVLDGMHHGKVCLVGSGAGALRAEEALAVQGPS